MSKQARLLTQQEFKRVLAVINANKHAQRNTAIFYLSFYAGLRSCEIASLKLIDVVDNDRKVKTQFVLEKHMTKGNERQRVIVSSALRKQLQKYVDSVCSNYALHTPFILSQKQCAFSALTITQLFARIYKNAGITGASGHSGRRQFLSNLCANGVSVRVIQALARHKSLNTTMRYLEITDKQLENAVESFSV